IHRRFAATSALQAETVPTSALRRAKRDRPRPAPTGIPDRPHSRRCSGRSAAVDPSKWTAAAVRPSARGRKGGNRHLTVMKAAPEIRKADVPRTSGYIRQPANVAAHRRRSADNTVAALKAAAEMYPGTKTESKGTASEEAAEQDNILFFN